MARHFLLDYLARDARNTLLASVVALGAGAALILLPQGAEPSAVGLRAAGGVSVAAALFGFYLGRHVLRPEREPSLQALSRYGPVADVLREIQEQSDQGPVTEFGRIRLLRDWITGCGVGVTVVRLDELVGVEARQTRERNWELVLSTSDGRVEVLHCPHEFAAQALLPLLRLRTRL